MSNKILLIMVIIFAAVVYYLTRDVPLSPTTQQFINALNSHQHKASETEKNSYYYLMGIAANNTDDPTLVGKNIFERAQEIIANTELTDSDKQTKISDLQKTLTPLQKPTNKNLFCNFKDDGCLAKIVQQQPKWQQTLQDYSTIHSRYTHYLQRPAPVVLATPDPNFVLPNYAHLITGQRLNLLHNLQLSQQGDVPKALHNLLSELKQLRHQLAQADTLIAKVVMAKLVQNQLQGLLLFKQQLPAQHNHIQLSHPIAPLTQAEQNMTLAFTYEAHYAFNTYQKVKKDVNQGTGQTLLTNLFYKVNMTTNHHLTLFEQLSKLSDLSPATYATQLSHYSFQSPHFSVKNYMGNLLFKVAFTHYENYVTKVVNLNTNINIVNHVWFAHTKTPVALSNPYAPIYTQTTSTNTQTCMQTPLEPNYNNMSCLWVTLP